MEHIYLTAACYRITMRGFLNPTPLAVAELASAAEAIELPGALMISDSPCPNPLLFEQVELSEVNQVVAHLRDCPTCLTRLQQLCAGQESAPHAETRSIDSKANVWKHLLDQVVSADKSTGAPATESLPPSETPVPSSATASWKGAAASSSKTAESAPLPQFGRYETLRLLGTGGMGHVYLARDRDLGRRETADRGTRQWRIAIWAATLPLPVSTERIIYVSVEFTNGVGLKSYATVPIELDPKTQNGIKGKVVNANGDPQRNTEVAVMYTEEGKPPKIVKSATTADDGNFSFMDLMPGTYQVFSENKDQNRKGKTPIIELDGQVETVKIELSL